MTITAAACQAELGTLATNAKILISKEGHSTTLVALNAKHSVLKEDGTLQHWYVQGNVDVGGRARWCTTTASDDAATQAAAILTQLRA